VQVIDSECVGATEEVRKFGDGGVVVLGELRVLDILRLDGSRLGSMRVLQSLSQGEVGAHNTLVVVVLGLGGLT
jgi:hypothetical protein